MSLLNKLKKIETIGFSLKRDRKTGRNQIRKNKKFGFIWKRQIKIDRITKEIIIASSIKTRRGKIQYNTKRFGKPNSKGFIWEVIEKINFDGICVKRKIEVRNKEVNRVIGIGGKWKK